MEQISKESKNNLPFFVENGDTYISNGLYDAILKQIHTLSHMKTLYAIMRHEEPVDIRPSWIVMKAKIHALQVYRSLNELAEMRVIHLVRNKKNEMFVTLNANHREWICTPPKSRGRNKQAATKGGN